MATTPVPSCLFQLLSSLLLCILNAQQLSTHFLLHRDYQQVFSHGLIVESKNGDFKLPKVNAYSDVKNMPKCDVVVIALKLPQIECLYQQLKFLDARKRLM